MSKKIIFVCHRHPFRNQGGAEHSVSIIMRHFAALGHEVIGVFPGARDGDYHGIKMVGGGIESLIIYADIVLTWGSVADNTAKMCYQHKTPYILMVRWWRNVCDVSGEIGDLRKYMPDANTYRRNKPIYDHAHAVVTNNIYSAEVIKRIYEREAIVSYVPIQGEARRSGNPNGCITLISPNKGIGEKRFILDLAASMPGHQFLIVNAPKSDNRSYKRNNITLMEKTDRMIEVWEKTKILVCPVYKNDICGTLRVSIEAQQHGIPVIANNRCGMGEQVLNLVPYSATTSNWMRMIVEIEQRYEIESQAAIDQFNRYDTPAQLKIFEDLLCE
jgi:hypothetical protein